MRLIVISQPGFAEGEGRLCTRLLRAGMPTLHIRKPESSAQQVQELLEEIPSELRGRIMLHQHHDLARRYGLQGLHYPERRRPPAPLDALPGLKQSTSFHKLEDLEHDDPAHWGPGLDYCFLSPIFDSISKQGYSAAAFDRQRLASTLGRSEVPVVALGGITKDRVAEAAALGFRGVAVLGSVWQAEEPLAALEDLLRACQRAERP